MVDAFVKDWSPATWRWSLVLLDDSLKAWTPDRVPRWQTLKKSDVVFIQPVLNEIVGELCLILEDILRKLCVCVQPQRAQSQLKNSKFQNRSPHIESLAQTLTHLLPARWHHPNKLSTTMSTGQRYFTDIEVSKDSETLEPRSAAPGVFVPTQPSAARLGQSHHHSGRPSVPGPRRKTQGKDEKTKRAAQKFHLLVGQRCTRSNHSLAMNVWRHWF